MNIHMGKDTERRDEIIRSLTLKRRNYDAETFHDPKPANVLACRFALLS